MPTTAQLITSRAETLTEVRETGSSPSFYPLPGMGVQGRGEGYADTY